MKNKQNILCLNTVQLPTYPPYKTIFLGTELVGAEFLGAELVRGRVGKRPSLLGAEFVRGRDVNYLINVYGAKRLQGCETTNGENVLGAKGAKRLGEEVVWRRNNSEPQGVAIFRTFL